MIRRVIAVGRWVVEVLIFTSSYNEDILVSKLDEYGASSLTKRSVKRLIRKGKQNTGFMYPCLRSYSALIVIGPTTSGRQFINTLSHEIHHLAVVIADNLGVDLEGETPAYITGDATQDLLDVICELGCRCPE